MRQKIRKAFALIALIAAVFSLTACGSTVSEESISYDPAYLQSVGDFLITNWNGMDEAMISEYAEMDSEDTTDLIESYSLPFTADAFTTAFAAYESSMEELGAYISASYEEPVVKGDEITLTADLEYELHDATLTIIFNKKQVAQSVTLDVRYSTGEILKKAALNTVLGMGTVFVVLIFISLVISCFNFIPAIQAKFSGKKNANEPVPVKSVTAAKAPAPAASPAPAAPVSEAENLVDDGELVAAITAAICAYGGTSSEGFVVRSIRRADGARWKR